MDVKNCQCYCKKQLEKHFLYFIDHRNDVKLLKTLQSNQKYLLIALEF